MVINTNIVAISIAQNILKTNKKTEIYMNRLSSGKRINSVKEDPAGRAIIIKMNMQVDGLEMARRNTLDGSSLLQTADGALNEMGDIVQRMRELAVQAGNDTNSDDDRLKIQEEINHLMDEIDTIADRTSFNDNKLFNGNLSNIGISKRNGVPSYDIAQGISIRSDSKAGILEYGIESFGLPAQVIGRFSAIDAIPAGVLNINGIKIEVQDTDLPDDVLRKLKESAVYTGIHVSAPAYPADGPLVFTKTTSGSAEKIFIGQNGTDLLALFGISSGNYIGSDPYINSLLFTDNQGSQQSQFLVDTSGNTVFVDGGEMIALSFDLVATADEYGRFFAANGEELDSFGVPVSGPILGMQIETTSRGPMRLHLGADKDNILEVALPRISARSMRLREARVSNREDAENAILAYDNALEYVNSTRGYVGALVNRLEYTANTLGVAVVATQEAQSRIEDTDMAMEMTLFTQANIISQAGLAMMAQANQRPQQLLQLL